MTTKKDGGSAFPIYTPDMNVGDDAGPGMSLRDWFAGQAITSIIQNGVMDDFEPEAAARAYRFADALLAERSK